MKKNGLSIQDRAIIYANAFPQYPDSHFKISDRWISATWVTGNNYKGSGFYGSYPPGYIKRVYAMFPEDDLIIFHLFSGSLKDEDVQKDSCLVFRISDKEENGIKPDFKLNAEDFSSTISSYCDTSPVDVIFADPPYSIEDAEHYGKPLCNKRKVLEECYKVLKTGGLLFWMDQAVPMYSKKNWKWVGVISIYRSTNHRVRGVMIFEKV